jgi:hypothetical protein
MLCRLLGLSKLVNEHKPFESLYGVWASREMALVNDLLHHGRTIITVKELYIKRNDYEF